MQRRSSDAKDRLIDKIVTQAKEHQKATPGIDIETYIRQYFRSVSAEDLVLHSAAQLCLMALNHLKLARKRAPTEMLINLINPPDGSTAWPPDRTILQTVCSDTAFLIDTISMVIHDQGLATYQTIHPILRVQRSPKHLLKHLYADDETGANLAFESFAHFELERVGDNTRLDALREKLEAALHDVQACTRDWHAMRAKATQIAGEIRSEPSVVREQDRLETAALLEWMADNHFTFLGYREYKLETVNDKPVLKPRRRSGLGILRGNSQRAAKSENPNVNKAILRQVNSRTPLIITKANSRSSVHRPARMDYIGVKRFDEHGKASIEQRFLGLFTSTAYSRSPRDIPWLRRKISKVMDSFKLPAMSHANKALMHILESFPRDELFQSSNEDLKRIAEGVHGLQERQRVKLFIRRDPYRRFISCMVYVPKDKYNTDVRGKIESALLAGFGGHSIESTVLISESALARLQSIVNISPTSTHRSDLARIEEQIVAAVHTWRDGLRDALYGRLGHAEGARLFDLYADSLPAAYEEDFSPLEATFDIERLALIDGGTGDIKMALYRPASFAPNHLRFKIFQENHPIPISDALPMLENMGMKVISERPYRCRVSDDRQIFMQEFEMISTSSENPDLADINQRFQDAFENAWRGKAESDGFDHLVISAGLTWRQTSLLRAYCRYLLQTGLPFSQSYMEDVFQRNPKFSRLWMNLFTQKFQLEIDPELRRKNCRARARKLEGFIKAVNSADEDRIFRGFYLALKATLRTNFYHSDESGKSKNYIAFKLDPEKVPGLPKPLPMFEVFVYSARMEGVHLRGGRIARGGLRWSDRREDFRTEVLGLMKAQKVKNTVIVPTGAKGGFVCKQLPVGDRDAVQAEVIDCYKTLIFGLLDLTDNLVEGKLVPPPNVVRHDADDPYMVVAADKGTATFSDIANGVAKDYNFWLGDAFASGGSVGYDHKGMGITAKGAWEAVKRHFRELGVNTQTDEFTVAGIGDMGGDVFGNGLLMSNTAKLLAAFNHLHIFIDPDPDPAISFAERERLFKLPRSSWEDYDTALLSKGGGIYPRSAKSVPLSATARKLLGLPAGDKQPAPIEVIKAILTMRVDLLWNGGIGTYIKSSDETHGDAGDRSNDAVRINGDQLRCKVVGEGGNLGVTQLGRIEYALNDGKINTDFIDNAGGVNCSDREVNIKILLNLAMTDTGLGTSQRNKLLASMTDEVEEHVLRDNYFQTQAISMLEGDSVLRANEHMGFLRSLEQSGELDRELEYLPSEADMLERQKNGRGLTRPELSTLLSYSKINLVNQLFESAELDNEFTREDLRQYFPLPLQKKYADLMGAHRLAREIMATQTANSLVNRMGPTYVVRTQDETGASAGEIARAYTIARETLNLRPLWRSIEALDNSIQAKAQYRMLAETARLLRRASIWLLQRPQFANDTGVAIDTFRPAIQNLSKNLNRLLRGPALEQFRESREVYTTMGVSRELAEKMAGIRYLYSGYDIAQAAAQLSREDEFVAKIYFRVGRGLRMTWLREQIEELSVRGRWQALARGTLRENLYEIQRRVTVLAASGSSNAVDDKKVADDWLEKNARTISRTHGVIADMRSMGSMDFATLSVAIQEMRKLIL